MSRNVLTQKTASVILMMSRKVTSKRHERRIEKLEGYGKKLMELRGDRSRREVSDAVNISISALTMYESEERMPRDSIKIALANYFGVSVEWLFFTK